MRRLDPENKIGKKIEEIMLQARNKLEAEWKAYNKGLSPRLQKSFEEFVEYKYGMKKAEQLELELEKQKDKNFDQQRQIGKERLAHKNNLMSFKEKTAERGREQREKDKNKLR